MNSHIDCRVQAPKHISKRYKMADVPIDPPSRSFKGKVAIVTGAGCAGDGIGNGRAISLLLADDGCDVICLDQNLTWAEKTAEMANSKPGRGKAIAAQGDVTSAADCGRVVQLALDHFGRLDVLVNNVGIAGASGTAVEVDMEQWAKSLEVNISSMVLMVKYAVPAMCRNHDEIKGSIINMGSVAGLKGGTPHLLYPTSKGAVVNMTRAMAAHHASQGIRVNCVCPGVSVHKEICFQS
jgi:NAD(P)-dependent dehydrogenase (short-subunit alcohol dehydrogenase family)